MNVETKCIYLYNGILFRYIKEGIDTCCNPNEPGTFYAKWKEARHTKGHMLYNFIFVKIFNRQTHRDRKVD